MKKHKSILIAIAAVVGIFLILALTKFSQIFAMVQAGKDFVPPPESVGAFTAQQQDWPNTFTAMGTVEADEGINISAEVAGKVKQIMFKSGEYVKAGTVILIQESGNESAQLSAATARLRLADANYERMVQLRKKNTVSQNELDTALQQKESAQGDVDNLKTTLEKKIVRAPFDGRLGIRKVDLGQDLPVGTQIVSLQATNRVRVNFPVPQHWLVRMTKGLPVTVQLGDGSNNVVKGEVTAVGADIDAVTRNATVQSSLENSNNQFIPGMAVQTQVTLSNPQKTLAVPTTAVIFAPFGDTVFVIEKDKEKNVLKARQQFVRLGKSRGDFIEIADGIKAGDQVVSAGAFKLTNGQSVVISKTAQPDFKADPKPVDN
ncbi:MexH family multidrug efflux RND transporter periplasmic adaptor subunit [Cellvibrio zantedeschiae]|uniref:MexH family multidrug efflux RND transporter periplasmic adaptor subunit n=1 Tax=Cellvibrio zantedeschiae TaxID=1237077 RepID=A0ABQ3AWF0_9GAMM|nr:efflux RND transporter periplasmic adaptor subunit [Cellvibrio zantedeschiae]GGY68974.1 MexH family multidrug efflux RND transporter periplasmic adaptor subunit [Cellvibrio zantedeschiae]